MAMPHANILYGSSCPTLFFSVRFGRANNATEEASFRGFAIGWGATDLTHPDHTDRIVTLTKEQSASLNVWPDSPARPFYPRQHITPGCFSDAYFIACVRITTDT